MMNSNGPKVISQAASDLGLAEQLLEQVAGKTEEEKRRKMQRAPGVGALGTAAVSDLFGQVVPK